MSVKMGENLKNLDVKTVNSFGDEWARFDQSALSEEEANKIFDEYFAVFPWDRLPADATGFDMGCGSGRWARLMVSRVGHLHCMDPSSALEIAKVALSSAKNASFIFHHKVKTTGFSRLALAAIMRFLNGGEHGLQARKD